MKTIEEASEEYMNQQPKTSLMQDMGIMKAFEAGVEFAQRWISVDEELPKIGEEVFLRMDKGIGTGCRIAEKRFNKISGAGSFGSVTHWRHVELK
jgi:hypothetical protein